MTVAAISRVNCSTLGCVLHYERIGRNTAFIANRRDGHEFMIEGAQVALTDMGLRVTGGSIIVLCRRCRARTLTVLDNV